MGFHIPLSLAFGLLGNAISFMVYLAPAPTFYRIWQVKSTAGFQSLPYLVALFSSMLWLYYGLLKTNATFLITINAFGCVVEAIYIILYTIYATKNARILTMKIFMGMNVVSSVLIVLIIQFALQGSLRVTVLGWVCTTFSICVFAAPLTIVAKVIKTKSVEFMPFNLSLFLTISAVIWFSYGLFLKDICIALPNVLGFILGLFQMILYAVYKNKATAPKEEFEQEQTMTNVVILSPMGILMSSPSPIREKLSKQNTSGAEVRNTAMEVIVNSCEVISSPLFDKAKKGKEGVEEKKKKSVGSSSA
ncbi:bidirectional sugar transporter N3-like [Vicia villosa]|uniref:bidirectional sugar transporter N3-like n=1 Tax=Vicia villosa TaxID=3911 RepID=UPI00273C7870|nr:bidirectional sugar transporter N3-like [Vicia villosa]